MSRKRRQEPSADASTGRSSTGRVSRNGEHLEQKALCEWLDWHGIGHAAIPNGGHRHPAVARKLRAEGVKAGMPDLLLFPPHSGGAHVMIEMKRVRKPGAPKGRLSTKQKSRIDELVQHNWIVIVAHGWQDAIVKLKAIGMVAGD